MHLGSLKQALTSELSFALQQQQTMLELPIGDRIAAGISWPLFRLREHSRQRQHLWLVLQKHGRGMLHDGIERGDLVRVSPATSTTGYDGRIIDVHNNVIEVNLLNFPRGTETPRWLERGELAITQIVDTSTYESYQRALSTAQRLESPLKSALLGAWEPLEPEPTSWPELNPEQAYAAAAAIQEPHLSFVHGPPGTGKTHLAISVLAAAINRGQEVWALADSNAATDHLTCAAAARGLKVLRLGSRYRIGDAARPYSIYTKLDNHLQQPALKIYDRDIDQLPSQHWRERKQLIAERRALLLQMKRQLCQDADLITCTLGSLGRQQHILSTPDFALIDEATQAIEPAIWSVVPLVPKLVLVGDPYQLGPVVLEPGNALQQDLFSRVTKDSCIPMLEEQHRMNAGLTALIAPTYGPKYRPHASIAKINLTALGLPEHPLSAASCVWVDTAGYDAEEQRDPVTRSVHNPVEVRLVVHAVEQLLLLGVELSSISIIAPYSAQVAELREAIPGARVDTVNAFQGQESSVVLCTFVRSNPDAELGFVRSAQRLVVSLSRAQHLWIGVGDSSTLGCWDAFDHIFDVCSTSPNQWISAWEWLED